MNDMGSRNMHTSGPLTRELYIPAILRQTTCDLHDAANDEYCFTFPNVKLEGMFYKGICNARAKQAGMNGQISFSSLNRPIFKARYER